jgi:hypothetical protein
MSDAGMKANNQKTKEERTIMSQSSPPDATVDESGEKAAAFTGFVCPLKVATFTYAFP